MRELRVALLDDNEAWLQKEEGILRAQGPQYDVDPEIHVFTDGPDLLASHIGAPDVLFSDIEIGDADNGIRFSQQIHKRWPACQVVFVTNHLRYALDVYVTEHLWFVLKDQFEQRLPEITQKLLQQIDEREAVVVLTTTSHEIVSVPCSDVLYLERNGRITNVYVAGGTSYLVSDRVVTLLEKLPKKSFARSHGSFAVNLSHVRGIYADTIRTTEGCEIPLSRRFSRPFRDAYLEWADEHVV